jgi:outer membrane immunogenic protein
MKKFILALASLAAFSGSAVAADLAARPYVKAPPPPAPVYNWTGFYVFGGGGGGLWSAETNVVSFPGGVGFSRDTRMGGWGWLGTVGAGYDWQFGGNWLAGVLIDGQWGSLRGSIDRPIAGVGLVEGWEKEQAAYAAGVRAGYLVAPNVLTYVNGGYSYSQWSGASFTGVAAGNLPVVFTSPSFHRSGWFVGGGVENSLNFFGITSPGLFMKTEYRAAYYNRVTLPETLPTGLPDGFAHTFNPWVQTITTSLVYRFNWTGPVVAKY